MTPDQVIAFLAGCLAIGSVNLLSHAGRIQMPAWLQAIRARPASQPDDQPPPPSWPYEPEAAFKLPCSCGASTGVRLTGVMPASTWEFAITCQGCGRSCWLTLARAAESEPAP